MRSWVCRKARHDFQFHVTVGVCFEFMSFCQAQITPLVPYSRGILPCNVAKGPRRGRKDAVDFSFSNSFEILKADNNSSVVVYNTAQNSFLCLKHCANANAISRHSRFSALSEETTCLARRWCSETFSPYSKLLST